MLRWLVILPARLAMSSAISIFANSRTLNRFVRDANFIVRVFISASFLGSAQPAASFLIRTINAMIDANDRAFIRERF